MHCFVNGTAFRQREWLFLQSNVAWPPPGLQVGTEENFNERLPDRTRTRASCATRCIRAFTGCESTLIFHRKSRKG